MTSRAVAATTAGADVLAAELARCWPTAPAAHRRGRPPGRHLEPDLTAARAALERPRAATAELLAPLARAVRGVARRQRGRHDSPTARPRRQRPRPPRGARRPAARDYELAGAVTHAQNEGRFAVMDQGPDGTRIYASELNDTNTCAFCAEVDGTEYPNMAEARATTAPATTSAARAATAAAAPSSSRLRRVLGHGVRARPAAHRARAVRPRLLPDARRRADRRARRPRARARCSLYHRSTTRAHEMRHPPTTARPPSSPRSSCCSAADRDRW
jgi:hypothetical protein